MEKGILSCLQSRGPPGISRSSCRKFSATSRESQEALHLIMEAFEAMTPSDRPVTGVCRDPKDDRILGCALTGEADYLVTGSEDLLVMKQFKAIRIIAPRDFELLFED
jgi:uncharacterized protein